MFDKSGLYNSKKFNIYKELKRFVRVITRYALITDVKLKLNIFIKYNNNSKYIVAQDIRTSLKDKPIAFTKVIVY